MRVDIADMVLDELQAGTIDRKAAVRLLQRIGQQTPIAVVGMGSLMGETDDYREIWEHYRTGGSFIDRASQERGDLVRSSMPPQTMESPTQMTKGNFLSDIHTFDWDLFDYTEEEARSFFPHARLALMAAFRAVEDAGLTGEHAAGHTTGVWVGYNFVRDQMNSYLGMGVRRGEDPEAMMFGSWTSGIATRISRAFDFRGPSQMVDGACASSAITIANACRELQNGTIDAALTGGFFLDLTPIHLLNQPGVFATATDDSVPKLYSRDNVGGFGGESYGFIVLKTLDRALKDGDRIHGVIRGWSESNAGGNGGFDQTAPESVRAAVRDVLKSSKTSVDDIGVVYGEGFAQPIEEALETNGLLQGIASLTDRKQFAALTTASSAMGYMQSAIGVLQMQLLVQAVRDATIPPLLHFDNPSDLVDLADSPFYVPTEPQEWPEPAGGERRGLQYSNAFGGFYLTFVVGPPPAAEDPSTDTAGPRTDTADSGADTAPEAGARSCSLPAARRRRGCARSCRATWSCCARQHPRTSQRCASPAAPASSSTPPSVQRSSQTAARISSPPSKRCWEPSSCPGTRSVPAAKPSPAPSSAPPRAGEAATPASCPQPRRHSGSAVPNRSPSPSSSLRQTSASCRCHGTR